jgi:penicillin amidase
MSAFRRWAYGLLGLGLLLLLALLAVWAIYRQQVLPITQGRLHVSGLLVAAGDVRIERDGYGIPTIRAASTEGALFGLGFVHAQDRLWQLETHRRIGAGRLAEAFGPSALDNDRFLRTLGVRRAAQAQWDQTSGQARQALEAYAAGINAYVSRHLRARPPEFLILGLQPERWTPVDSLTWSIMMAWDLGGNWTSELLRLRLAQRMSVARINELLPPYPGEQPLPSADYVELARQWLVMGTLAERVISAAPESGIEGVGSNNWAVSGRLSRSGKPLLANDPHLKLTAPALWYFARLEAPGLHVAGATMPGLPLVVLGQNQSIAWGFTNTAPDVQDLYLERIDPDDTQQYQVPDGWRRFESHEEIIHVRGASSVTMTARVSRHGPVISDAAAPATAGLTGAAAKQGKTPQYAIAMRWTALDADVGTIEAGLRFNQARSVPEFIAAAAGYSAPMQNMLVADAVGEHGHIALVVPGKLPVRSADNDLHGLVPAPGWEARYDWQGYVAPRALPSRRDPPEGWLATANQRIVSADYPYFITSEWMAPYRQQRIEQLLAERPKHDVESFSAMQRDQLSLGARALLSAFQASRSSHPLAAGLSAQITRFDGQMSGEQAAPLVFHAWVQALSGLVFADELGPLWSSQFSERRSFRDALEGVLARDDAWWCDNKDTAPGETCRQLQDQALDQAYTLLQSQLGDDSSQWRWDRMHVARSEHRPFSKVPALKRLFELRVPVGGDSHSINATRVGLKPDSQTGELFLVEHAPSLRAVYDLADPSRSRFIHSSGQSGIALTPDYRSFSPLWAAGKQVSVWPTGAADQVLTLTR